MNSSLQGLAYLTCLGTIYKECGFAIGIIICWEAYDDEAYDEAYDDEFMTSKTDFAFFFWNLSQFTIIFQLVSGAFRYFCERG